MPTTDRVVLPAEAGGFRLPGDKLGVARLDATTPDQPGSHAVAEALLLQNHNKWDMFFRDVAGHNHIPHAVLTTLAMGGTAKQVRRAYDDGEGLQRPRPAADPAVVRAMADDPFQFLDRMQDIHEYSNFLAYFEHEIGVRQKDGGGHDGWHAVVNEHVFARTPQTDFMLAQLFEGLYHPLIHLGFGIEFGLAGLVAEGLAHAACHDPMYIDVFFQRSERLAQKGAVAPRPLADIYRQVRASERIRTAARLSDGPWKVRDGVLGRAMEDMIQLAAQVQVAPTADAVARATAEMISCAAWTCATTHAGKEDKIDFFLMHNVTASLFLTVLNRQPWIALADKARLVEYKARLDLVWYAASAAPATDTAHRGPYQPTASRGMDWPALYGAVNELHDDGHIAKFVRACRNGEEATAPYDKENDDGPAPSFLPVRGGSWLQLAQMCYDTTCKHMDGQKKWVWGAGFDAMWKDIPDVKAAEEVVAGARGGCAV